MPSIFTEQSMQISFFVFNIFNEKRRTFLACAFFCTIKIFRIICVCTHCCLDYLQATSLQRTRLTATAMKRAVVLLNCH